MKKLNNANILKQYLKTSACKLKLKIGLSNGQWPKAYLQISSKVAQGQQRQGKGAAIEKPWSKTKTPDTEPSSETHKLQVTTVGQNTTC